MANNSNQPNKSYQYPPEDKEILAKMEHPNYEGFNITLSPNATPLEYDFVQENEHSFCTE
jgi:hypothetical protein